MTENIKCVYVGNDERANVCYKKFNRGKKCKLLTSSYKCRCYLPVSENAPVFDDEKWFWKSSYNALGRAFDRRIETEAKKFVVTRDQRHKDGHYQFIPRGVDSLMRILIHSYKYLRDREEHKGPKFLDCGCGVGNAVLLAQSVGFDAYGIEYDRDTLESGKEMFEQFGVDPKKLFQGDILEYENYHEYDLLYGYCPMTSRKKEHDFECTLKLKMKKGALLAGLTAGHHQQIGKHHVYFKKLILESSSHCYEIGNPYIKVGQD